MNVRKALEKGLEEIDKHFEKGLRETFEETENLSILGGCSIYNHIEPIGTQKDKIKCPKCRKTYLKAIN